MIEFTILLNDAPLEFEPHQYKDQLQLFLPPTARIGLKNNHTGQRDSTVHLAPIPVHCFFNAITFGHWLAEIHGLSQNDAFIVYTIHDMFKAVLRMRMSSDPLEPLSWAHQDGFFFNPIETRLQMASILDDFRTAFHVASRHNKGYKKRRVHWREATTHEEAAVAGAEAWNWPMLGLTIRLQSALSNIVALAHVKQAFIAAYIEAVRSEFPDVFSRYDAVSYRYEFIDPTTLTGNPDLDIPILCGQSDVRVEDRTLVIQTFIGSQPSVPGNTTIRLPFWLLLTLHQDPTSILFPVPTHHQDHHPDPNNTAFVTAVKANFAHRFRQLLTSVSLSGPAAKRWPTQIDRIMAGLDEVCHIFSTIDYDAAIKTRAPAAPVTFCTMCGSEIPDAFACSPQYDLGASVSNYTDWHIGAPDQTCVLCAVANFKTPLELEPARKLIFQRKIVYFTVTTPAASVLAMSPPQLPFFDLGLGFVPQLSVISLESLITLNLVGALYLYDTYRRVRVNHSVDNHPLLWLEAVNQDPFTFIGFIGSDQGKGHLLDFLTQLQTNLSRHVHLLDSILPMDIEIPLQSLIAVLGVTKGRHFQLKYKPLTTSNHQGIIPLIWAGYHLVDGQTLAAARQLADFVSQFKSRRVNHRMKLTALAASPSTFIDLLIEQGGYNYETLYQRLQTLSGNEEPTLYLSQLRDQIRRYPLITELWE